MGWKGNVRAISAAYKRSVRESERREREDIKQKKQYNKEQQLRSDRKEFEEYQEYYCMLISLHEDCSKTIIWHKVLESKQPSKPKRYRRLENNARKERETYKSGFFDKLFKRDLKKIEGFNLAIVQASQQDKMEFDMKMDVWQKDCEDWKIRVELAKKIIANDAESKLKVIEKYQPFSEISGLGTKVLVSACDDEPLNLTVKTHGIDIIPTEVKTLLQSGKLSVKKMPKGKYYELFQDHVCSAILRVANEIFAVLPDELVIINAVDDILNTKTGHKEEQVIVSAAISRQTIESINFKMIDPSDCMENFVHNMSFKKTKGFNVIEALTPLEIQKNS